MESSINNSTTNAKLKRQLRPSLKTVYTLICFGVVIILLAAAEKLWPSVGTFIGQDLAMILLPILFLIIGVDYYQGTQQPTVDIQRELSTGLALNKWVKVTLLLQHSFNRDTHIELFDGVSDSVIAEGARMVIPIAPGQRTKKTYRIRPLARGLLEYEYCHVRCSSPLKFWHNQYKLPVKSETKVFPDFAAIAAYTLLAAENNTSELGIRVKSRRGEGMSFHQLREYRQGDSLRQLDWKATARRQKLISKEYQDERDQNIILLIDSGRRMRSKDDELSHFDHALNAAILISYIALRQGDSVSVMSFGNDDRWIPPQKGSDRVKVILNGLYDIQADNSAPDYLSTAAKITQLQGKRSLVVLITNSRDEEIDELTMAVNLLKKRHLVLVANIREAIIDTTLNRPIESFDEATSYIGTVEYQKQRTAVHQKLKSGGIYAVDCLAKDLAPVLANSYSEIKRTGVL